MPIERSRNRMRSPASGAPRPDGISRRVATAARDRRIAPLREQRPTGWHRIVYANPARPEPPAWLDADGGADSPPPSPGRSDGSRRRSDAGRPQLGRVFGPPPAARRRSTALVLAGAVGAAAATVFAAVVLLSGPSAPEETGPAGPAPVAPIRPGGWPSALVGGPDSPRSESTSGPAAVPPADPRADPAADPSAEPGADPATDRPAEPNPAAAPAAEPGPDPAQVTTLTPGDPGFGWPATAFGSAPPTG